jgi:hypothetical protein
VVEDTLHHFVAQSFSCQAMAIAIAIAIAIAAAAGLSPALTPFAP